MLVAGVDGCPAGWIEVRRDLESRRISSQVFINAADLFSQEPEPAVIAIDIPIGLTDAGPRLCDLEARKLLAPLRQSSIFPAPIRRVLRATNYDHARKLAIAGDGTSISRQAWGLVAKIKDVDEALRRRNGAGAIIKEVHPEVSFRAWNDQRPMPHAKRSAAGKRERLKLVVDRYGEEPFKLIRQKYSRDQVGDDDILDAFAALWSAERIAQHREQVIPQIPFTDAFGIRMEIVY